MAPLVRYLFQQSSMTNIKLNIKFNEIRENYNLKYAKVYTFYFKRTASTDILSNY